MRRTLLRPVYDRLNGEDGFVSPRSLAISGNGFQGHHRRAERLRRRSSAEILMVKVPATDEGLPAIERLIGRRYLYQHHAVVLEKVYRR